ncbi:hypothetical protein BCR33DRAFT_718483 [Rhizoclosmatium globosum]|uniref:Uncharacterized protein n=1 Tax=Rhizoclosmatium globosum TaxID=329046 RepID=A0A1Y2C5M6_9FUNG|nr:hypothetical protein BCR33DRAFT_718483 [Rhizoclosmatium globosum]|eukprot:ORY42333.1 hypothetical protein BCR33DRAFT_718483 [Rhizoclosmatium globosum]
MCRDVFTLDLLFSVSKLFKQYYGQFSLYVSLFNNDINLWATVFAAWLKPSFMLF